MIVPMPQMVTYWAAKDRTDLCEWEDGAAYSRQTGWFAVADGASTGSNSMQWAYALASGFISDRPTSVFDDGTTGFVDWVGRTRASFDPRSDEFRPSRAPKWVQAAGAQRGSHATLLAGRIADGMVRAVAVGDCCLFWLRAGALVESFPLTGPDDFGSSPHLVPSRRTNDSALASVVRRFERRLDPGDTILVTSDALAEWLTTQAGNQRAWQTLSRIGHTGFQLLCDDLRAAEQMKNDDVTLFRASLSADRPEA